MTATGPASPLTTPQAELRRIRRELHAMPELSRQEHRTAAYVEDFLRGLRLDRIRTGVGGAGILAVLEGGRPGPTILLRADMDALPIGERTGAPYASRHEGVMHACGHDAHMSILLNAARTLAARRAEVPGRLVFCFQPAEEGAGGNQRMIDDGALDDPLCIDRCFALHVFTGLDAGLIGVRDGAFFASADQFTFTLRGIGGHGANPHQAIDPIVAGAQLVGALQCVVSRELPPKDAVVVSVGSFQAGESFNVIPDHAVLQGTVRCFDAAIRAGMPERLARIGRGVAEAFRVEVAFDYARHCPPLVNDAAANEAVRRVGRAVIGAERVIEHEPVNWAEDMALMQQLRPGAYFLVGARGASADTHHPHHSPFFDLDETALDVGYAMMVGLGLGF